MATLSCKDGHEEVRWNATEPGETSCWICGKEGFAFNGALATVTYPSLSS